MVNNKTLTYRVGTELREHESQASENNDLANHDSDRWCLNVREVMMNEKQVRELKTGSIKLKQDAETGTQNMMMRQNNKVPSK